MGQMIDVEVTGVYPHSLRGAIVTTGSPLTLDLAADLAAGLAAPAAHALAH